MDLNPPWRLKTDPDWEASNACRSFYIGQSSKTGCLYDTPCYRKGRNPAVTKSGAIEMICRLQTTPKLVLKCRMEVNALT